VTTPNASERFVVDSSGWVEYLGDGPKSRRFAPYLEKPESVWLPTIVVCEVYKKLLRERRNDVAAWFLSHAFGYHERLVDIDVELAECAARISLETKLAMADAMIYAAAKTRRAHLVTADSHFAELENVTVL
jgi:toxin FitB